MVNSPGSYILDATYIWGDNMYGSVFHTINIKKSESFIDTLRIPRIKFTWDGVLHSQYWNYFDCEQLCNGVHSDTYPNGSKRMEGRFENGKPSYITSFRIDGTKEMTEFYNLGKLEFERIEYFDRNGQLSEYEVHKNKKLKTITITYSAEGEKLGKEVTKHIIEK